MQNQTPWLLSFGEYTLFDDGFGLSLETHAMTFFLQAALDWMVKGHMLADVVAIIGKLK